MSNAISRRLVRGAPLTIILVMATIIFASQTGHNSLGSASAVPDVSVVRPGRPAPASAATFPTRFSIAALLPFMRLPDGRNTTRPHYPFCKERVSPAIDLALERIGRQRIVDVSKYDLVVTYADSRCESAVALNQAIVFYMKQTVSAFFGPCCDYAVAPIARQMTYWDKPLLTSGAMASEFGTEHKRIYPLLTRVGANFNSLTDFVIRSMHHFRWNKIMLAYDAQGHNASLEKFCHLAADALHKTMRVDRAILNISQDHIKFEKPRDFTDVMRKKLGRDYASKLMF